MLNKLLLVVIKKYQMEIYYYIIDFYLKLRVIIMTA